MIFPFHGAVALKRSGACDLKMPENGSESPSLSDHRFSHSPSMAYPLAGCFVSAILLKLRHLRGLSVRGNPLVEKAQKTVSDVSPARFPSFFSV